MTVYLRQRVTKLTKPLNDEGRGAGAADLTLALIDRIELTPNEQGQLDVDLYDDLASTLSPTADKDTLLDTSDQSVQLAKMAAGACRSGDRAALNDLSVGCCSE